MTKYVCKCGRIVNKSTSADNTGNRDTAGCDGCPYLLPWGPFQWDETRHAMVTEIKGYECRMSPTLNYATYYQGSGADKCVLHIYSLDYDFLERVAAWTAEHFPDKEISCNFSRDRIRAVEFIGGLYRMSVYPVQNKKGIAAKAALLEHFFDGNGARKDMTPDEEKARILAAIEDGKARAQKKETNQMNPIISENLNNGGTYAYYAGRFWVYGKTANEWFVSDLADGEYQKARKEDEDLTPEDFMIASNVFAQLEDWEITTEMVNSLMRTAESVHPQHADEPDANPTQAAPASPADAGAAEQSPSDAEAVSLAAESAPEAFDYTGLDNQTVADLHLAEREYLHGRKMAEMGLRRMADGLAIAHDALCGTVVHNVDNSKYGNRGEESFRRWCESIGVGKSTAYKLLQVSNLFDRSTPREQKVLEELSPSLLYAAAKPSAPAELVQGVKSGDITTHKQYQDALAQLKAAQEARQQAEAERDEARREAETERRESEDAHSAAMHYKAECDRLGHQVEQAESRAKTAEQRAQDAEQKAHDLELRPVISELYDAKQRIHELESRPVEVAVQEPTEEQIAAAAKQRTKMVEAQLKSVQEQLGDALDRVSGYENNAYMAAAAFAGNAAMTINSIRATFWALSAELPEEDFADAVAPLDEAVRKIYDREWEDEEE